MTWKRSQVRVLPYPPAFACFASFGSASHHLAKAAASKHEVRRRAEIIMKYVYILQSESELERFYVGITDNLEARLSKHNAGDVSHTTKYKPWRIKTYIAFTHEKNAFEFEKYLKSASGRAFAKKRL